MNPPLRYCIYFLAIRAAIIILAFLVGVLLAGCAFSLPLSERVRCDIQIDAQLISTEPLPAIWLHDK
jgi:hypothetical protein